MVENEMNLKVKCLRYNNGEEYEDVVRFIFVVDVTESVITPICNTGVPGIPKLNQQDSNTGK